MKKKPSKKDRKEFNRIISEQNELIQKLKAKPKFPIKLPYSNSRIIDETEFAIEPLRSQINTNYTHAELSEKEAKTVMCNRIKEEINESFFTLNKRCGVYEALLLVGKPIKKIC